VGFVGTGFAGGTGTFGVGFDGWLFCPVRPMQPAITNTGINSKIVKKMRKSLEPTISSLEQQITF
jgi:hypothetical protein